jgi:hypothetical protein
LGHGVPRHATARPLDVAAVAVFGLAGCGEAVLGFG